MNGIVILIILFLISRSIGSALNKKGVERPRSQPAPAKGEEGPVVMRGTVRQEAPKPIQQTWADLASVYSGGAPADANEEELENEGEGESRVDKAGCVGGSLAHDDHEETKKQAPKPAAAYDGPGSLKRKAEKGAPAAPAFERARVTPEALRSAVIMSEILGKPKALRGRCQIR